MYVVDPMKRMTGKKEHDRTRQHWLYPVAPNMQARKKV